VSRFLVPVTVAALLAAPAFAQEEKPAPKPVPAAQDKKAEDASAKTPKVTLGMPAVGEIVLKDIDGKEHKVLDLKDKITVVNFWSMTCPIMKGWEDRLVAIQNEYTKKGVHFVTINSNEGNGEIGDDKNLEEGQKPYEKIRSYLKKNDLPYTVLVDKGSKVADVFAAQTTPDIFLFDKTGTLVYRGLIDDDARGSKGDKATQYLRDTLDALLAGDEVEVKETKPQGCSIKRPRGAGNRQRRSRG